MSASTAQHHGSGGMLASLRFTWRWAALALASLALSLAASLMPLDIGFHCVSDNVNSHDCFSGVKADIRLNSAYANPAVVQGAKELIIKYSTAAGIPAGEFLATVCGAVTASTGMLTATSGSIRLDGSLEDNLSNLADAADYPEWSSLDTATQEQWGTKENYDSAKFVSLLDGLGFSDVSRQYYDSYDGSGGGNFEPTSDVVDTLKKIGRIGKRWSMGLGNNFVSLVSLISDRDAVMDYFGGTGSGYVFNGTGIEGWPSTVPYLLNIGNGSVCVIRSQEPHGTVMENWVGVWKTDSPVWSIALKLPGGDSTTSLYRVMTFSKSTFKFGGGRTSSWNTPAEPDPSTSSNARWREEISGHGYYYGGYNTEFRMGNIVVGSTFDINELNSGADIMKAIDLIMATDGENINPEGAQPDLSGYPEDEPDPDEEIYYPYYGINNNNTWNNYLTKTFTQTPDNPFNPDDETNSDQWKDETEASYSGLEGVHFDKLFPFCLLADIGLLFNKMQSLGILPQSNQAIGEGGMQTQGAVTDNSSEYLHVRLPISSFDPNHEFIQDGEQVDFDLVPLHDLLIMVRPAVQILLVVVLLFTLIDFWRGVLAG